MSLFNFQGPCFFRPLSRVPCDYITSFRSCQELFLIFFDFFFASFLSFEIELRSFWRSVMIPQPLPFVKHFFNFFCTFSEDPFIRDRSLECLHILPQENANVNTIFKLFSSFFTTIPGVSCAFCHIYGSIALIHTTYMVFLLNFISHNVPSIFQS